MIKQPLLQLVSTQTDVTGSRAIDGTVYQNTLTKPLLIVVTINFPLTAYAVVYCDQFAAPSQTIGSALNSNLAQINFQH